MAHYIGDVTAYVHSAPFGTKAHHSGYEGWVGRQTKEFDSDDFSSYINADSMIRRKPFTAVKRISKITAGGKGKILWATRMGALYPDKNDSQKYKDSVGGALNLGVNELADVLHRFYLNEITQ